MSLPTTATAALGAIAATATAAAVLAAAATTPPSSSPPPPLSLPDLCGKFIGQKGVAIKKLKRQYKCEVRYPSYYFLTHLYKW